MVDYVSYVPIRAFRCPIKVCFEERLAQQCGRLRCVPPVQDPSQDPCKQFWTFFLVGSYVRVKRERPCTATSTIYR